MALPRAKVIPPTALVDRVPRTAWLAALRVEVGRRIGIVTMIEQGRESEVLLDRVVDVLVLIEVHQVTGAFVK